jgi:hypothetical protein
MIATTSVNRFNNRVVTLMILDATPNTVASRMTGTDGFLGLLGGPLARGFPNISECCRCRPHVLKKINLFNLPSVIQGYVSPVWKHQPVVACCGHLKVIWSRSHDESQTIEYALALILIGSSDARPDRLVGSSGVGPATPACRRVRLFNWRGNSATLCESPACQGQGI